MKSPVLAAVTLGLLLTNCSVRREAARDVWALWLEYEPSCLELFDAREPLAQPQVTERWERAFGVLASETLTAMEERLAQVGQPRGRTLQLLEDLVASSRRLCELAAAGAPIEVTAPVVQQTRAELASARSRLGARLALGAEEVYERTSRYTARLSGAVSRSLDKSDVAGETEGVRSSPASEQADPVEVAAPVAVPPPPPQPPESSEGLEAASVETHPGVSPIVIESVSGDSWEEIRRRRGRQVARRLAGWRPLYTDGLRSLAETRLELARGLDSDSLSGLRDLCARLETEVRDVPTEVVEDAPERGLRSDLERMLEGYSAAGRACSEGRSEEAWTHLVAADSAWKAAARRLERLDSGSTVPPYLLGSY